MKPTPKEKKAEGNFTWTKRRQCEGGGRDRNAEVVKLRMLAATRIHKKQVNTELWASWFSLGEIDFRSLAFRTGID